MARRRWTWAVLLVGVAAISAAVTLIVLDLIAEPRDRWAALCFAAGSLAGAAWDRYGRGR